MDTVSFFTLLAELMKQNPPYAEDAPILARLGAHRPCPRAGLRPVEDRLRARHPGRAKAGGRADRGTFNSAGEDVNGWVFFKPAGLYGTDYLQRALVTRYRARCNSDRRRGLSLATGGQPRARR